MNVLLTQPQRKALAELLPELAERLQLQEKNPRRISFTVSELQTIQETAKDAIPNADSGIKRSFLRHILHEISRAIEDSDGIGSIPAAQRLYQFKITLIDSQPPVWRRIQVKDCTLDKLHERIQTAMGWTNSHLHQFKIKGICYGDPDLLEDGSDNDHLLDSTRTKISEIIPKSGKRFRFLYEYDFGDGWIHEVLFEGCLNADKGQRYPICVEGERACPPENVGGVWGYLDFLKALADPEHEQHDEFIKWAGPFDPEVFDAGKATKAMQRGLPDWRKL